MMRTAMAKEAFNRKISLLTRKLNIELGKKLIISYIWIIAFYVIFGSLHSMFQRP